MRKMLNRLSKRIKMSNWRLYTDSTQNLTWVKVDFGFYLFPENIEPEWEWKHVCLCEVLSRTKL